MPIGNREHLPTLLACGFIALVANSAYVASFPSATLVYVGNVLLHLLLGIVLLAAACVFAWGNRAIVRREPLVSSAVAAVALTGAVLAVRGAVSDMRWVVWIHTASALVAIVLVLPIVWRLGRRLPVAFAVAGTMFALMPMAGVAYWSRIERPRLRIANERVVAASMDDEGAGRGTPFFPSPATTSVGGTIPSNFFMDPEHCGDCHRDIYEQWKSSVHHFASFNNQFYRKSIEYMQSVVGAQPSKWCAGCHDHAVFFNGRFDRPIREQIDTPEAHAGLSCTSCHSIVHVRGSIGNGALTIEYPPLHDLASSRNRFIRAIDRFVTYLNPEPHRRTFMKPFMRSDSAEFCAVCHKVHLDVPVNGYRWFRGFNDYDNWQASGISGQGARSFYYPTTVSTCVTCHMPLVPSRDPGHHGGRIHSHRFAAANTAVPFVNHDRAQLDATEAFLTSGFVSVDIFAVAPFSGDQRDALTIRTGSDAPAAMTGFAVGEESDHPSAAAAIRRVGNLSAPIDAAAASIRAGEAVRVDVVVRTRKIGHFFPGGTVDAFDVWLELQARDARGRLVFWSGRVEDEERGPVEKGAHFYRSLQLDGAGNPIDKRNAWQARSLLYARLIPPGAADVAHFRLAVPPDAAGPLTLTARLRHRKFSHYYTQFAYAGQPKPNQAPALLTSAANSLEYTFNSEDIPANVSGAVRDRIPTLPIVTLAEATAILRVGREAPVWAPVVRAADRERWNDWGIGLLLQGDLKGAEFAFRQVTHADPAYADGWLNVARALVQEGEHEAAAPYVDRALQLDPGMARAHYFRALIQKSDGDYDGALRSLRTVAASYPRDRVVWNQIGRVLFLNRRYADAVKALDEVRRIDPEDVQLHYTLMLCFRALGDPAQAAREELLFKRFKAEESAQAITARRRLISPEDNNERQPIHDHVSVSLEPPRASARAVARSTPQRPSSAAGGSQ